MSTTPSHTPTTVSLADEEAVRRILVDTLFGLWVTVNNLTRLRPWRHERYRVTVFGSARTEPGHWVYEEVKQTDVQRSWPGQQENLLGASRRTFILQVFRRLPSLRSARAATPRYAVRS
jgi:hypothetical protein